MPGGDEKTEIERLRETLRRSSERVAELSGELRCSREELVRRGAEIDRLEARLGDRDVERLQKRLRLLEVRLARIHSLAPVRLYNRMRGVPPVSWIVARRTRGYRAEIEKQEGD